MPNLIRQRNTWERYGSDKYQIKKKKKTRKIWFVWFCFFPQQIALKIEFLSSGSSSSTRKKKNVEIEKKKKRKPRIDTAVRRCESFRDFSNEEIGKIAFRMCYI